MTPAMANPRCKKINQKDYTHYLVLDGKILSGWSFKEDAKDAKDDLPVEWQPDTKIYTKRYLKSIGLDPEVCDNWGPGRYLP